MLLIYGLKIEGTSISRITGVHDADALNGSMLRSINKPVARVTSGGVLTPLGWRSRGTVRCVNDLRAQSTLFPM